LHRPIIVSRHALTTVIAIGVVTLVSATPSTARRASCEVRCGYRVTQCVLGRGGVDGREVRPCTRAAVRDCRRRGKRACPLPTRAELTATLAAVQAVEATVHQYPLCAAVLPDVPAATLDEAIAVGRDAAAALAGSTDLTFRLAGPGYRPGAFVKLFLQGFSGHGAAFIPLGNVVVAIAHPARSVSYQEDDFGAVVHGVVGTANGQALGVLLTYCPSAAP